jgi:hypothetical protein
LWLTENGGATFAQPETVPMPEGSYSQRGVDFFMPPVADESGRIYVPFTHNINEDTEESAIFVSIREADGAWRGPFQLSASKGNVEKPWGAAGPDGSFAVAYYQTNSTSGEMNKAEWFLEVAATVNACEAEPTWQRVRPDPEMVLVGPFGRYLGDFLQADVTPDGKLVVVYTRKIGGVVENLFVQSDGALDFTRLAFPFGPQAGVTAMESSQPALASAPTAGSC